MSPRWKKNCLMPTALSWLKKMRRWRRFDSEMSSWWSFVHCWNTWISDALDRFIAGMYLFSPLIQRTHKDGSVTTTWCYEDRLMVRLLLEMIKPTFSHLISSTCHHLKGPRGVRDALQVLTRLFAQKDHGYRYVIRIDIASYYASISHALLLALLKTYFHDPRLIRYFEQIIGAALNSDGDVTLPTKGVPTASSLSPFFGALYLSALDRAFENCPGIVYVRYMDDVVILVQSQDPFKRAKRRLFSILRALELTIAPSKSKMGKCSRGFHFLGANFGAPQSPRRKKLQVTVAVHSRTLARALDKASVLRQDAVDTANIQGYLYRWASWWSWAVEPFKWASLLHSLGLYAHDIGRTTDHCVTAVLALYPLRTLGARIFRLGVLG